MAEKKQDLGPVKRFGTRYGATNKYKRAAIEIMQKQSTKCPYCNKNKVVKKSIGIWHCKKCNSTFTGQAYTFTAKPALTTLPPVEQATPQVEKQAVEEAS